MKDLQQEIHKLEHKLYPEVVSDIANKKISLSNGKVIRK
jgi:folate-dependent phosphoribosylglycinamide formyltransferase PurN